MLSMWWLAEPRVPVDMTPDALISWVVGQDKAVCAMVETVGDGPGRFATVEEDNDGVRRRWEWSLALGGGGLSGKASCRAIGETCNVTGRPVAPGAWVLESAGVSRGAAGQSVEPYHYLLVVGDFGIR